jgi:hypothetical protein
MTFDESNARITNELTGRTIDHVVRNGKALELHTACGHCVKLQSDVNHDIHFAGTSVHIKLDPMELFGAGGF